MNNDYTTTLATELLHELKQTSKRWFMAFCIMVVLEVITITGFMLYISLPTDESVVSVENDEGNANYIGSDLNGVLNNGESTNNGETNETSSEETQTETLNGSGK